MSFFSSLLSVSGGGSPPLGLYVHIPFCLSRCGYCAFVSGVYDRDAADRYLIVLENEVSSRSIFSSTRRPSTLFIGGGTPSALSVEQLERLLAFLPFPEKGGEATCELNPDSASCEKMALLLAAGVNRCSFGVQTFCDRGLELLQRRHNAECARDAVRGAVAMGFSSVNLDLIVGWPGQKWEDVERDLRTAVELGVTHLSCYQLILEDESACYEQYRAMSELSEDQERELWDNVESFMEHHGFEHYETSNFARPGYRCIHNYDTWRGCDYLGIGLGAHSHIGGRRFANTSDLAVYLASGGRADRLEAMCEELDSLSKARECAVFWLRLFEGIKRSEFRERAGVDLFDLYPDILPAMVERGIMERAMNSVGEEYIRVAREYHPILDSLLADLV